MAHILSNLFRQAHGYLVTTDPDPTKSHGQQAVVEHSTITCGHCNAIVSVPANCPAHAMPYALCWGCRRNICAGCDAERARTLTCDVIEKKLERWENAARFHRDLAG